MWLAFAFVYMTLIIPEEQEMTSDIFQLKGQL